MKLFTNHRNWWSSLTSTFIGSLLGIGITFGLSDFIQKKQQREVTRKLLVTSVAQIESRCDKIGEKCKEFSEIDSLFTILVCCSHAEEEVKLPERWLEAYAFYINEGSSLSEETAINSVLNSLMDSPLTKEDPGKDENQILLSNDVEVLNVLHDLSIVDDIKSVHLWLDKVDTLVFGTDKYYKRLQSKFKEVKAVKYDLKENELLQSDDFLENLNKLVDENKIELRGSLGLYFYHSKTLQSIYKHLVNESLPLIKKELHVTSEEINSIKSTMRNKLDSVYEKAIDDGIDNALSVFKKSTRNSYRQLIIDTTNLKK